MLARIMNAPLALLPDDCGNEYAFRATPRRLLPILQLNLKFSTIISVHCKPAGQIFRLCALLSVAGGDLRLKYAFREI